MFGAGVVSFLKLNIEAYPDPVPPLVDVVTQNPGAVGRGDRALHHDPDRDPDGGHSPRHRRSARSRCSASRTSRCNSPTTSPTTRRSNGSSIGWRNCRRCPMARPRRSRRHSPIGEIYRYRVVGPPGYSRHRSEDHPGLDPRAPLQGGARGHRRHRLGRQDQDLRDHRRSRPSAGPRAHPAAGAAGAQQQQHQCRRPDRQFRAAGRGRARRRPDPLDGSDPQHDADGEQRRLRCVSAMSRP